MAGDKLRFRFRKADAFRLLSHHDLMRCFERMLRRAGVPFKSTAGFHPAPRVVFALSLPLGVVGVNEVVEIELTQPLEADDVLDRLNRQAPAGLRFSAVEVVPMRASAVPRRVVYRLGLPPDRVDAAAHAAGELLAEEKVWADKLHPRPRRVNVRPYIRGITTNSDAIALDLWVTGQGTARAEDLFRRLGLADLLDAGAVLERTDLEIHDEVPAGATDAPPDGPPETAPLDHAAAGAAASDDTHATAPAVWGLSPNGPVVE